MTALSSTDPSIVIIGGGFYGVNIALHLARHKNVGQIIILEREKELFARASYANQARVHNGYHYPRSFATAYRSRINLPTFIADWPEAVKKDFINIYAIANNNSKVTSSQFQRFCQLVGAKIKPADDFKFFFNPDLIEEIFLTEEYVFDYRKIADWAVKQLSLANIEVIYDTTVTEIRSGQKLSLTCKTNGHTYEVRSSTIYNCTYSGLNQFGGDFNGTLSKLKHEITEIALMQMPVELEKLGVTVIDGPFFSIMPFPSRKLHTLSHVRYTPHMSWLDQRGMDPYAKLANYDKLTRSDRMIRDAQRYLPGIKRAIYKESLFEVKTVLVKNEVDDGRPILFEKYPELPGFYSVLGGKIDNIYDILKRIGNSL